MENLIILFLSTGFWLTWIRPIYSTLTNLKAKQWLEFWMIISTLVYLELNIFPEYSRELSYNFLRTMTLFLLSERAVVASSPKKQQKKQQNDDFDELPCENITEKMVHLERFDDKTKIPIIEKLLASWENSMLEFDKKIDWVSTPKSIRSCTAYKFAMILASGNIPDERMNEYAKSKIPELLISMVQNPDIGERDSGVLAVCYLIDRCKKVRKIFFELNLLEIIHKIPHSKVQPMFIRAIVAIIGRILIGRDQAKAEFIRSKMSLSLIKLLESEVLELVAETSETIRELVMKSETILNKAYLGILANQGLSDSVQIALKNHGSNNKLKISLRTLDTLIKSL